MTGFVVPATGKQVRLAAYPDTDVREEHFTVVDVEVPAPGDGQVVVRNEWMGMGAVYRDQMNPTINIPIPVFGIGEPMWGRTVGTVVRSNSPNLPVGRLVEHFHGWRDYAVGDAWEFYPRDRHLLPGAEYFLSNGPTAWRGMVDIARVGAGDVVFVSGATSGVGSLAGQIARRQGAATVIGSTGSREKIDFLLGQAGFDAAFDYHDGCVADQLRKAAPDGVDVCFDNVGGDQLEAAIEVAKPGARFALCGSLSRQHGSTGAESRPRLDLVSLIPRELSLRGFATLHTADQIEDWNRRFGQWLREDRITFPRTTVAGGVSRLPRTFVELLAGAYSGMVVAGLSDDVAPA